MSLETINNEVKRSILSKEEAKNALSVDYSVNFSSNEEMTIINTYGKKDDHGKSIETLTQIYRKVSLGIAIARLKYTFKPFEIIQFTLDKAIENETVLFFAAKYYKLLGERKLILEPGFALYASPDISLNVLQYEAHGQIIGSNTSQIWNSEKRLRARYENLTNQDKEKVRSWISDLKSGSRQKDFSPHVVEKGKHEIAMGYYASKIKRKGVLQNSAVIGIGDSIEDLEKAIIETVDTVKSHVSVGLNTSSISPYRPSNNNDIDLVEGPDYYVDKILISASELFTKRQNSKTFFAEARDTNHPDITKFLNKKLNLNNPNLHSIYSELISQNADTDEMLAMEIAVEEYGQQLLMSQQNKNIIKNVKLSVRATDGFMESVENKEWYPAVFNKMLWTSALYDFAKLSSQNQYEEYSVSLDEYPEAEESAMKQGFHIIKSFDNKSIQVKKDGAFCFYAPDIYKRICAQKNISIQFAESIEKRNANNHKYELNTSTFCGRYALPAQIGIDGSEYRGICNEIKINPVNKEFFDEEGNYKFENMELVAECATEFMDDLITVSHCSVAAQNSTARKDRKIGVGISISSENPLPPQININDLYGSLIKSCMKASKQLAVERGAYESWQGSTYSKKNLKLRNSSLADYQVLDLAGIVSVEYPEVLSSCTCSIHHLDSVSENEIFEEILHAYKLGFSSFLSISDSGLANVQELNQASEFQELFNLILDKKIKNQTNVLEINKLQSQANITQEISLKFEETKITTEIKNDDNESSEMLLSSEHQKCTVGPRSRPKRLYGFNEEVITPDGSIYVHVYYDNQGPRQVFTDLASADSVTSGLIEALCRTITKALKWGCPPRDIAEGLLNIQGRNNATGVEASSIPDAIGKILLKACVEECPVCATKAEHGGMACTNCGWTFITGS